MSFWNPCSSFTNQTFSLPYPPSPCSQCILFGDNGSHWQHIVHDWLSDNMISCCVSVCWCNYPWRAGIPTNTMCKVHSTLSGTPNYTPYWLLRATHCMWLQHVSMLMHCVCVCDIHYYRHTHAMCFKGWTKQIIMIKHRMSSAQNMVCYGNFTHSLCCLSHGRFMPSSLASSLQNSI